LLIRAAAEEMLPNCLTNRPTTKEISMKLRHTFMLVAAVAVMAFVGTVQVLAQGARQRPFSDWLDKQTSCTIGWQDQAPAKTFAVVDYTGKFGDQVENLGGPTIDTEVDGTVRERDLPDGRAEILLNVHFKNGMAYAHDLTQPGSPRIFGFGQTELIANPNLSPALASGHLEAKFIIDFPGAPLQNFCTTAFPNQPGLLLSISIRANADGPLRAAFGVPVGTPGKLVVSQTGLYDTQGQGNGVADAFPAEIVRVFKVGK
jgi:hypothetical protein